MASSSSQNVSENMVIGNERLVPDVPNPYQENDEPTICLAIEQPPVIISLTKNSKRDARLRASEGREGVSDEIKLPRNCYANLFIEVRVVEGSRNIFLSAPINFRLPEDSMDQILRRDEDMKSTFGMQHLPLTERLEGWKIEKRQRPNLKIYDKYFHHNKSGLMFRSFPEVVRFIIHASLPTRASQ